MAGRANHEAPTLAVMGSADWLAHMRVLLPSWIDRLGWAENSAVVGVYDDGGPLRVELSDGRTERWDKVMTEVTFAPRDALAESLGCKASDAGHLAGMGVVFALAHEDRGAGGA